MSSDVLGVLDGLAARGRRLHGQLPGDYKPIEDGEPAAEVLARVYALILSWPAVNVMEHRIEDSSR